MIATNKIRRSKEFEDKLRGFATQKTSWTQDFNRDFQRGVQVSLFQN